MHRDASDRGERFCKLAELAELVFLLAETATWRVLGAPLEVRCARRREAAPWKARPQVCPTLGPTQHRTGSHKAATFLRRCGVGGAQPLPVKAYVFPTFFRQIARRRRVRCEGTRAGWPTTAAQALVHESSREFAGPAAGEAFCGNADVEEGEALTSKREGEPPSPEEPLQLRSVDSQTASEASGQSEGGSSTHREAELSTLAVENHHL